MTQQNRRTDRRGGIPQCGPPVSVGNRTAAPWENKAGVGNQMRLIMKDPRRRYARVQELKRNWRLTWQRERDMLAGADGAGTAATGASRTFVEPQRLHLRLRVTPEERQLYLVMLWALASESPAARALAPIVRHAVSG